MSQTLAPERRRHRSNCSVPSAVILLIALSLTPLASHAASFGVEYRGDLTGIVNGCKTITNFGPCPPPDPFPAPVDTGFLAGQSTFSTSLTGSTVGMVNNVPVGCGPECGVVYPISLQTADGRMSGTASLGALSGVADVNALAALCCLDGAFGPPSVFLALARGTEMMHWQDTLTVTSPTLPAGVTVNVLVTLTLQSGITHADGPPRCQGFTSPATATAILDPGGVTLSHDFCAGGGNSQTETRVLRTVVGAEVPASGFLFVTAEAVAGQAINLSEHTTLDAGDTAVSHFDPLTPDVFLLSASGHEYSTGAAAVPEPGTMLLLASGVAGLHLSARRSRR